MKNRVWEICGILCQISSKHLHLSLEEKICCNLCTSIKKGPIHFHKIVLNGPTFGTFVNVPSPDGMVAAKMMTILKDFKDRHYEGNILVCLSGTNGINFIQKKYSGTRGKRPKAPSLSNSFRVSEDDERADPLLEKKRNLSIDDGINEPLIQKPKKN